MIPEPVPEPVRTRVCSICDLPWSEHLERAKDRVKSLMYDPDTAELDTEERAALLNSLSMSVVNDCVPLLKKANRGPEGPPGLTGPMGNNPPPCPHI